MQALLLLTLILRVAFFGVFLNAFPVWAAQGRRCPAPKQYCNMDARIHTENQEVPRARAVLRKRIWPLVSRLTKPLSFLLLLSLDTG